MSFQARGVLFIHVSLKNLVQTLALCDHFMVYLVKMHQTLDRRSQIYLGWLSIAYLELLLDAKSPLLNDVKN